VSTTRWGPLNQTNWIAVPTHPLDGVTPELPPEGSYWIAPTASVIGNVRVGAGVGIWFGAVVRGDGEAIIIGKDTNLQEQVVVHTDPGFPATIGKGCTIGHRAIVHGASIGDNVLVGMGAIVLNGARVGADCLIGAGAVVAEGREIPPGSLVLGVPGKVIRPLSDDEVVRNRASAAHYVTNWHRFAAGFDR
jgi:carbonic anhydrase/acetyltransferase-like protein (isoleucine patch superfamily)